MKVCVFQCRNEDFRKQPLALEGCGRAGAPSWWSFLGLVQKDQPVRLKPRDRLARQGPFPRAPALCRADHARWPAEFFLKQIADADEPT